MKDESQVPESTPKKPWYNDPLKAALFLIFFPITVPAALLWGIWAKAKWPPAAKWIATFGILAVGLAALAQSPPPKEESSQPVEKAAEQASEEKEEKEKPDDSAIEASFVQVTDVVDGDTVKVTYEDGKTETVRLIGIDTPETKDPSKPVEPFGKEASEYTTKNLKGKYVWLETDAELRDKYGRLLAYLWFTMPPSISDATIKDSLFNAHLVRDGYAKLLTIPPNVKYSDQFVGLQEEARVAKKGLWGDPAPAETPQEQPATTQAPPPPPPPEPPPAAPQVSVSYIGNSNTMKFHRRSCRYVDDIYPEHIVNLLSRDEAIGQGFVPCKVCDP